MITFWCFCVESLRTSSSHCSCFFPNAPLNITSLLSRPTRPLGLFLLSFGFLTRNNSIDASVTEVECEVEPRDVVVPPADRPLEHLQAVPIVARDATGGASVRDIGILDIGYNSEREERRLLLLAMAAVSTKASCCRSHPTT